MLDHLHAGDQVELTFERLNLARTQIEGTN
jgi:hypothetical protein